MRSRIEITPRGLASFPTTGRCLTPALTILSRTVATFSFGLATRDVWDAMLDDPAVRPGDRVGQAAEAVVTAEFDDDDGGGHGEGAGQAVDGILGGIGG